MRTFTVLLDDYRQTLRYVAERPPAVGETIVAEGVEVIVSNVLHSIDPSSDAVRIEARRSESADSVGQEAAEHDVQASLRLERGV